MQSVDPVGANHKRSVLPTCGENNDQYADRDMPHVNGINGPWTTVVRAGEDYEAMLGSLKDPNAGRTLFTVTQLPSTWKFTARLGQVCTRALEGPRGALMALLASTRDAFGGVMSGLGAHEWVGRKSDPGRRIVQYASGLPEPDAAEYHTRMQRDTMPRLSKGESRARDPRRAASTRDPLARCSDTSDARALTIVLSALFSRSVSVGSRL